MWFDADGDGTQDAGEPGLAGVDVVVRWAGPNGFLDDGDDVVRAATTDADGTWSVADLASGVHRVSVDTGTLPPGVSAATADLDGPGTPHVAELVLAGGSARTDADFGARGVGAVGGTVFHDVDGDRVTDPGEGTASVHVTVRWAGANGVLGDGDDAVITVATGVGGSWSVDGLPAGTVRTVVDTADLSAGATSVVDPDGGADFRSDLVLAAAEVVTGHDHGYVVPAPIGGSVFEDHDADGTVDAGDGGVPSIDVVLEHDADGDGGYETPLGSLTTDADGTYTSTPLPPGRYRVSVTVPSGAVATTATVHEVVVASADDAAVPPVGLVTDPARSIGDLVWFDADGDGGVDPGEPGLAGIGVEVRWAGPDRVLCTGDDRVRSTTTGVAGAWVVDELLPGDHEVTVEAAALPAGLDMATADPDGPASAGVAVITVPVGSDRSDVDFGYRGRGSLAGVVFHDIDADRAPGSGEGVASVGVTVTWSGPNGTWGDGDDAVVVAATGSDGSYSIDGLPAGPVHVVVDGLPSGAVSVVDPDGGADFASGHTLTAGEHVTGHDHGFVVPMPLTGLVWEDVDADGIVDPSEEGAPGMTVVRGDLDGDGTFELLVGELVAADDGHYTSGPLLPGRYRVTLVVPEGAVATTPTVRETTVASGVEAVVGDLGIVSVPAVAAGDLVWVDLDGDAQVDPGEPGLPGVDVSVRWAGPDGVLGTDDDRVRSTTTDDVGAWTVDHLVPGEHEVSLDPTTRPAGLDVPTADPDGTASEDTARVLLPAGGRDDVDFGYRGRAAVGGVVFHDVDADDTIDLDEPLDGVTVTVTWSGPNGTFGDGDDAVVEVVTEADGRFGVNGLPAGTVRIEVDGDGLPMDAVVLVDPDDDGDLRTERTLTPGGQAVDLRFGVVVPGSIGRRVWADLDGDGEMDADEPGLAGVRVTLFEDRDGDGEYETERASQVTSADGTYRFSGLLPSDYRVQVDPSTVPVGGSASTPLTVDVRLGASAEFDGGNFGFQAVPPSTTAPPTTRPTRLPDTGSDPGTPVAIGAVLVLAGLVLAGATRRRRPT